MFFFAVSRWLTWDYDNDYHYHHHHHDIISDFTWFKVKWGTEFRLLNHHVIIFFFIYIHFYSSFHFPLCNLILYNQPTIRMNGNFFLQWKFNTIMMKPWNWFKAKYNKQWDKCQQSWQQVNKHGEFLSFELEERNFQSVFDRTLQINFQYILID